MKQTISKIIFFVYIFCIVLFYAEILLTSILNRIDGFLPQIVDIVSTIIIPFYFLVLLILNPKRFLKIRYFLINILPFFFCLLYIGEIIEHGLGYIF